MSNPLRILPVLLSALLLGAAAPAVATAASAPAKVQVQQARFGGFRGARRPSFGSRYRSRPYRSPRGYYRRPSLFRGVLRALGIAFLLHALFGWGAGGGSPFGLLLVLGVVVWLVSRSRRRRAMYGW